MNRYWYILRWILILPTAILASQIATSLFLLISIGSPSELYFKLRPFIAEGFGGFGFIYGGVKISPKKDPWIIWSLFGLYVLLAVSSVLLGQEFYSDLFVSIACIIGAIIGASTVRENE